MSIATDITGSAGGGDVAQAFSLLAVVANPDVYGAKLKALVEATEENKKFLALVGPANEILAMREKAAADKAEADRLLKQARTEADSLKAAAKEEAAAVVATARADADKRSKAAAAKEAQAAAKEAAAQKIQQEADDAAKSAAALQAALDAEKKELAAARAQAERDKAAAQAEKAALIAKHKAFIESL